MSAIKIARKIAKEAFDTYLIRHKSAAALYVPQEVIEAAEAAEAAYAEAGGKLAIVVVGHGNRTHPVCGIEVRIAR